MSKTQSAKGENMSSKDQVAHAAKAKATRKANLKKRLSSPQLGRAELLSGDVKKIYRVRTGEVFWINKEEFTLDNEKVRDVKIKIIICPLCNNLSAKWSNMWDGYICRGHELKEIFEVLRTEI